MLNPGREKDKREMEIFGNLGVVRTLVRNGASDQDFCKPKILTVLLNTILVRWHESMCYGTLGPIGKGRIPVSHRSPTIPLHFMFIGQH